MFNIIDEYRKLQNEYVELRDVAMSLVDAPGNRYRQIVSPISGKKITCPECAGLFTTVDDKLQLEIVDFRRDSGHPEKGCPLALGRSIVSYCWNVRDRAKRRL
jgi:hypothetical protein